LKRNHRFSVAHRKDPKFPDKIGVFLDAKRYELNG
jgi:hypothetical protein